jgi:GAF domain-containing protein
MTESLGALHQELAGVVLVDRGLDEVLTEIVHIARRAIAGSDATSITLIRNERAFTAAYDGQMAMDADEMQYERGHGPCLHAARTGEAAEIADTRADSRWPDYTRSAAERGVLSSLSVPLVIDQDEQIFGGLNMYAREPVAFDADSRAAAMAFGPYAAVAAGNVHAYHTARTTADHLKVALDSRTVIGQATGILIERYKLTADQAFRLLSVASMNANRKLRYIAEELVLTGELPAVTPGGDRRRPGRRQS